MATGGSSRDDGFIGRKDLDDAAVIWLGQIQSTFWRVVVGGTVVGSTVFPGLFFSSTVWRVVVEGEFPAFS
jgi:hypothetical protein